MKSGMHSYSVLMPLAPWEPADVVQEALASLERQTLPPSEVVVSCDGPPSAALSEVLKSNPLPLVRVDGLGGEGVGPVLARGLLACRHDFVVRADADDISVPHRCQVQVAWLADHPDVIVLSSWIEEFREDRSPVMYRRVPCAAKEIQASAKRRNPLNHPAVIFRRQGVLSVGNYRSRPGFEDYDLWLRLLRCGGSGSLANLPEPLVRARVGRAHLARRHGCRYANQETRFFLGSAREGLISWQDALVAIGLRLPLRLLPSPLLAVTMRHVTRSGLE